MIISYRELYRYFERVPSSNSSLIFCHSCILFSSSSAMYAVPLKALCSLRPPISVPVVTAACNSHWAHSSWELFYSIYHIHNYLVYSFWHTDWGTLNKWLYWKESISELPSWPLTNAGVRSAEPSAPQPPWRHCRVKNPHITLTPPKFY